MALEKYTGKSAGTTLDVGSNIMPGWDEITIEENGRPLPATKDVTDAEDTAYSLVDDPLGGDGAPNCVLTVKGFISVTDHQDTNGWLALAKGTAYAVVVTVKALGDTWTQADMVFKDLGLGAAVAEVMPFNAKFTHSTLAGAWSTDA